MNNLNQYKTLHQINKNYGKTSIQLLPYIQPIVNELKPKSILDFGCGKGLLLDNLKINCIKVNYDPGVTEFSKEPKEKFDLVINTDVLEHIHENELEHILNKIKSYSNKVIFCICIIKAQTILPNGENAHCTVKPYEWWKNKLNTVFNNVTLMHNIKNKKIILKTWK
jgi:2-polyprenyl-3-methyl-5-hydroxy-6-metoxy-1,4-benzoquinol methylase